MRNNACVDFNSKIIFKFLKNRSYSVLNFSQASFIDLNYSVKDFEQIRINLMNMQI